MEYLLPKLDHQEQDAVVLGYGLYREISAEIFSVEMIQALLYQTGKEKKETTEQEGKERPREENPPVQMEETLWEEQEAEAAENFFVEAEEEKDEGRWKNIVEAVICIGFLGGVLALRWTQAETVWYLVLGGAASVVGIVILALELVRKLWEGRRNPETRRNRRCIFGISESEGLKTERWNMESAKRYRTAGMEKGFLSRKRENMGKE